MMIMMMVMMVMLMIMMVMIGHLDDYDGLLHIFV